MRVTLLGVTVLRLHTSDTSLPHGFASAYVCIGETSVFHEKYLYR